MIYIYIYRMYIWFISYIYIDTYIIFFIHHPKSLPTESFRWTPTATLWRRASPRCCCLGTYCWTWAPTWAPRRRWLCGRPGCRWWRWSRTQWPSRRRWWENDGKMVENGRKMVGKWWEMMFKILVDELLDGDFSSIYRDFNHKNTVI